LDDAKKQEKCFRKREGIKRKPCAGRGSQENQLAQFERKEKTCWENLCKTLKKLGEKKEGCKQSKTLVAQRGN